MMTMMMKKWRYLYKYFEDTDGWSTELYDLTRHAVRCFEAVGMLSDRDVWSMLAKNGKDKAWLLWLGLHVETVPRAVLGRFVELTVARAITDVMLVYKEPQWQTWATNWLNGVDRQATSAIKAAESVRNCLRPVEGAARSAAIAATHAKTVFIYATHYRRSGAAEAVVRQAVFVSRALARAHAQAQGVNEDEAADAAEKIERDIYHRFWKKMPNPFGKKQLVTKGKEEQ